MSGYSVFSGVNYLGRNIQQDGQTLDAHVTNFNNPHNVTPAQVQNTQPLWNANQLQGIPVSSATPSSGQIMAFDTNTSTWKPLSLSASSPMQYDPNTGAFSVLTGTTAGTVAVGNDPRFSTPELVQVKKTDAGAGEFTSISDAIASITDASPSKPYEIHVGPGNYVEPPLVMKQFVSISGENAQSTIITCTSPMGPIFTGADGCSLSNLTFNGANNTGGVGIYYTGQGTLLTFTVKFCAFNNNDTAIKIVGTTQPTVFVLATCSAINTFRMMDIQSSGMPVAVGIGSLTVSRILPPYASEIFNINGPGIQCYASNILANYVSSSTTTGILLQNGALLHLYSSAFSNILNGVKVPNVGSGPTVYIRDADFENCKYNIRIEHPNAVGNFAGFPLIRKTAVARTAHFSIEGNDPNTYYVYTKSQDFPNILSALNFINPTVNVSLVSGSTTMTSNTNFTVEMDGALITGTGIPLGTIATFIDDSTMTLSNPATSTGPEDVSIKRSNVNNKFIISISPGIYTEADTLRIPQFVSLVASSNVYIQLADPTKNVVQPENDVTLRTMTIMGAMAPGASGLYIDSATGVLLFEVTVAACDTCITVRSSTGPTQVIQEALVMDIYGSKGLFVDGSITSSVAPVIFSSTSGVIQVENGVTGTVFDITGPYAQTVLSTLNVLGNGTCDGVHLSDGASLSMATLAIRNCNNAILVLANGLGPNIQASNVLALDSGTRDLDIEHPGTTGVFDGILARSKVFVVDGSEISLEYLDPEVNGSTTIGNYFLGSTNTNAVEIRDIVTYGGPMGVMSGGVITVVSGLTISVANGMGYLMDQPPPDHRIRKYYWNTTQLVLPANSTSYIFIDLNGNVTSSISKPSNVQSIYLGRVVTDASAILFIDASPMNSEHVSNRYDNFIRNAIGPVVANGLITMGNTSRQLSVSTGRYYYSENEYFPTGGNSPVTFTTYFHNGGSWSTAPSTTVVDNSQYDDGTNLTPIPAGEFVKHSLYMIGEGVNEKYFLVYGQATFPDQVSAEQGAFPAPPPYFTEGMLLLAGVIVQEGNATFIEIQDRRPTITTNATALTSTLIHGNLLGLDNDDHKEYLLVNGTRAMGGDLNLGTNNIVNASTVNGVTVQAHASRHVPLGADPLPTATPTINLNANVTNTEGTANSFARSNHTHSIDTGAPVSIGTANSAGTSASLARSDHVHRGVGAITVNSGTQRVGILNLVGGTGVTLTDPGDNNITINVNSGQFKDNATFIVGATDASKRIGFDVSDSVTNTTTVLDFNQTSNRTLTFPDATDTLVGQTTSATLANKNLLDDSTFVVDTADTTKRLKFDLDLQNPSTLLTLASANTTNKTITFPDITDTVVTNSVSATLANKNLLDDSTFIVDTADTTKKLKFDLDLQSPSTLLTLTSSNTTNRTVNIPDTTDTLVTNNFAQTLTNKTLTDVTNNINAKGLFSTGGNVIDVSSASAPTTGQVLTSTSANTATWQTPTAEANTASNAGTSGVGVFLSKVGVNLQFKNIDAGSNKVSVVNDVANNTIDIDVVEANISRNNLADTLLVANGGTGVTSLTSGNVVVGNGTGPLTATKVARGIL